MIAPNRLRGVNRFQNAQPEGHPTLQALKTYARKRGIPMIGTIFKNPIPPSKLKPTSRAKAAIPRVKNLDS